MSSVQPLTRFLLQAVFVTLISAGIPMTKIKKKMTAQVLNEPSGAMICVLVCDFAPDSSRPEGQN